MVRRILNYDHIKRKSESEKEWIFKELTAISIDSKFTANVIAKLDDGKIRTVLCFMFYALSDLIAN